MSRTSHTAVLVAAFALLTASVRLLLAYQKRGGYNAAEARGR